MCVLSEIEEKNTRVSKNKKVKETQERTTRVKPTSSMAKRYSSAIQHVTAISSLSRPPNPQSPVDKSIGIQFRQ